ncbi:MAG: M23 family metallopeptidase [Sandaracinaceae bacterium]
MRRRLALLFLPLVALLLGNGPWFARRRPMPRPNRIAMMRVTVADWPDEPASPSEVDPAQFATALRALCGWMRPGRATEYTGWILASAEEFEIDPFLLGALAFREGRCRADAEGRPGSERESGVGLTLIDTRMYWENLRGGTLRYQVREGEDWTPRTATVDRFPFNGPRVASSEANLYFAGALLAMWRDQHEALDDAFENTPHRHFVSHWMWGDRVRSHRQEDAVLTERRRLLEYYGSHPGAPHVLWGGVDFGCPLDGCPRVITSWIGSEREDGRRHHRGIDLESLPGEPVRSVADGLVVFSGVDLPGGQTNRQLRTTAEFEAVPRESLAAGGRYVCVRHAREGLHSVRSCYMHLDGVLVHYGDRVTQGQQLGTVGRTGMQRSAAHLHFELATEHLEDPSEILHGLVMGNREADPL